MPWQLLYAGNAVWSLCSVPIRSNLTAVLVLLTSPAVSTPQTSTTLWPSERMRGLSLKSDQSCWCFYTKRPFHHVGHVGWMSASLIDCLITETHSSLAHIWKICFLCCFLDCDSHLSLHSLNGLCSERPVVTTTFHIMKSSRGVGCCLISLCFSSVAQ